MPRRTGVGRPARRLHTVFYASRKAASTVRAEQLPPYPARPYPTPDHDRPDTRPMAMCARPPPRVELFADQHDSRLCMEPYVSENPLQPPVGRLLAPRRDGDARYSAISRSASSTAKHWSRSTRSPTSSNHNRNRPVGVHTGLADPRVPSFPEPASPPSGNPYIGTNHDKVPFCE